MWKFGIEHHLLACAGMLKPEGLGMEHLTRTKLEAVVDELAVFGCALSLEHLVAPVTGIGKERMTYVAHVGTYLMSATRLKHTFDKSRIAETL